MKARVFSAVVLAMALGAAFAQDAAPNPSANGQEGPGGRQGRGGGRGGWMGGGMGGRGLMGTVTEATADHYSVKTEQGETYTIHFSVNTRFVQQMARRESQGEAGSGGQAPQQIKAADIKVGDAVGAMGEVDASTKSIGAVAVVRMDPARAKQILEMQANYGKTWLMGRVTAIDGVKVTLMSNVDNVGSTFAADENTTFRKRREPVTLADIQVGDMVRVEGAVKDGVFLATTVSDMGTPPANMPGPGGAQRPQ